MTTGVGHPLYVVLGAGGPVGDALIRVLARRGSRVRAVSRSPVAVPAGVEFVTADATNSEAARTACEGAAVVFHTIGAPYHRWREMLPPILEGVLDAASHAGAKLVYADNLYAYGPADGALTEDLPLAAEGTKGRVRAELARRVLDVHREGRLRTTIGRSSDFFGPGVRLSAVGERVFANALAGRAADLRGDIDALHTYTYIDDFARGLVTLGDASRADGQAWHIPSCEPLSTRRFVAHVFEQIGQPVRMRVAPAWLLRMLGWFDPLVRELPETAYQFARPFVMDTTRYESTFGADPTPIRTAIGRTIEWYQALPRP